MSGIRFRSVQTLFLAATYVSYLLLGARPEVAASPPRRAGLFDLLILNGLLVDGSGKPAYRADIGIRNGRIARIGSLGGEPGRQTIDAQGLVVAPGFIDVHTHLEEQIKKVSSRFTADNFILQGVTTVITGNCGRSAPDVEMFFKKLARLKLALNIATLVGHNTVRQVVCGSRPSKPRPLQIQKMESLVEAALESGALGLSTGLCYKPGLFAAEDEVVALVRVCARHGGVYATHIRDEGAGGMAALEEALRTAQSAGAPKLHVSHFKAAGRSQWGTAEKRLDWLRRTAGPTTQVTADLYPYTAISSLLDYLIPQEAFRRLGGPLKDREKDFTRAVDATLEQLHRNGWQDYSRVRIAFSEKHQDWIGRTIPQIVADLENGSAPTPREEAAWILKVQARGDIQIIAEEMSEQDLRQIITSPEIFFGSDSSVHYRGVGRPHPRGSGTFPRIFGEYVRELKLLRLEDAVRRATSLPAETFELPERGRVQEGFWADLLLFDPSRIRDRATPENPWHSPDGIPYVIENGRVVVRDGKPTGALPGQPVRRLQRARSRERSQAFRAPALERLNPRDPGGSSETGPETCNLMGARLEFEHARQNTRSDLEAIPV